MYRDVLKVYDSNCILYNTDLEQTNLDVGSGNYMLSASRATSFVLNWEVLIACSVCWILVFIGNRRGVYSFQYISYLIFPMTIACMFILVLWSVTLEGSTEGYKEYLLGKPDSETNMWEALQNPEIWLDAAN